MTTTRTRITQLLCVSSLAVSAVAQSTFNGFTPGNIVVSRSVYSGTAASLAVGQPLPPVCPPTASCGTVKATDNGAYASTNSANNVFNNNKVDGSFGITSPILLDQMTPTGTLVNSLQIPTSLVTTSFSSKSEVALNVSPDGTALTFMGYVAPANVIDVSNSNTPGAYDPTNPAGGSFFRAVVQVGANGAIMVTPTNSYSGNNGRAAILANGNYYMVGNANNGGGTPTNIVATAGVQMAIPGQSLATPAIQLGTFSIAQVINPATGLPYPGDKLGKDNNFRGLTIFNNTLYVTKGSGSNGINTVYQVGDKGSLPTLANAASVSITPLKGFPVTLAKSATMFPFGSFFANATTLYVADEGDGTVANAAASKTAGLQKWVLTNGTWTLAYVLQNGLKLGQPYSVTGYPASLNPAPDGLRNITGRVNNDGTVTIFAITSTVSANGDQGADPNQLVSITDNIANTSPALAASETFTLLRTANAGEILRGVSLTPVAGSTPAVNVPLVLNAASTQVASIAPGGMATVNGVGLALTSSTQSAPYPTLVNGLSISIVDNNGVTTTAPLVAITPNQITFLVPPAVAPGTAQVIVNTPTGVQTANNVEISTVAPALLTVNGSQLAAAQAIVVSGGAQTVQSAFTTDANGAVVPSPITVGTGSSTTYLLLFGTGIAAGGTAQTTVTINGVNAPVAYAGPSGSGNGLDQVNVILPAALAGKGNVNVQLTSEMSLTSTPGGGFVANPVQITVK